MQYISVINGMSFTYSTNITNFQNLQDPCPYRKSCLSWNKLIDYGVVSKKRRIYWYKENSLEKLSNSQSPLKLLVYVLTQVLQQSKLWRDLSAFPIEIASRLVWIVPVTNGLSSLLYIYATLEIMWLQSTNCKLTQR